MSELPRLSASEPRGEEVSDSLASRVLSDAEKASRPSSSSSSSSLPPCPHVIPSAPAITARLNASPLLLTGRCDVFASPPLSLLLLSSSLPTDLIEVIEEKEEEEEAGRLLSIIIK